jgi:type III secretion protein J
MLGMHRPACVSSAAGKSLRRLRVAGLLSALCVLVAGCQNELYSNLTEYEANQMLAVLMANGISAEKTVKGKGGFTVQVAERDMLKALSALNERGFPKSTRESIGKVFQKSGIMSSPFEERVRYIYALGEEVAQTLSQIDGVVTARVHIVLPDAPQLGQPVKPSSAAVFIKHQSGVDLDFFTPQIRRLVSSSIEGLQYNAVSVVLAEAAPAKSATPAATNPTVEVLPGLAVRETDKGRFWQIVGALIALVVLLGAVCVGGLVAYLRGRRRPSASQETAVAVLEPT